jgi:glycosyltransferase involved in cell wall biosynthesis
VPATELDIVMPVYNEGVGIVSVIRSLVEHVRTPFRILICHDHDDDTTLAVIRSMGDNACAIECIRNRGSGVLGAIVTGFDHSTAPAVLMMPADDDYNAPRLDAMVERIRGGADIVCPSRFFGDGCMVGCPLVKAVLVRLTAWFMYHIVGVPTHDPTNGFRMFSRRVIDRIPIETAAGFAYSMELLVKAQRLGWRIEERPVQWFERKMGQSRFRVLKWAPSYLRWVWYALTTRFLGRGPETVVLRKAGLTS